MIMIKTVILGSGPSTVEHIKILKSLPDFEIAGIFDKDSPDAKSFSRKYKIPYLDDHEKIFSADFIDVTGYVSTYFTDLKMYIKKSGNLYIEDFGKQDINQIELLYRIAEESKSIYLFGKKDQFSTIFAEAQKEIKNPRIIHYYREIKEIVNSTDKYIYNHLVYDIDLVLNSVLTEVKRISVSGCVLKLNFIDFINIRIEFVNGTIADISARVSGNNEKQKLIIYQPSKSIKVDFIKRKMQIENNEDKEKQRLTKKGYKKEVYIKKQFKYLANCISTSSDPYINIFSNFNSLKIANQVYDSLKIDKVN